MSLEKKSERAKKSMQLEATLRFMLQLMNSARNAPNVAAVF